MKRRDFSEIMLFEQPNVEKHLGSILYNIPGVPKTVTGLIMASAKNWLESIGNNL